MIPKTLTSDAVLLALRRLSQSPLPDETVAQVAYHVGWLSALDAVLGALDVPEGGVDGAGGSQEGQTQNRPGIDPAGKGDALSDG